MRIIEVTVSAIGQSTVHTTGFAGCRLPPGQPVSGNCSGPTSARTTDQRIPSSDQQSRARTSSNSSRHVLRGSLLPFVRLLPWLLPLEEYCAHAAHEAVRNRPARCCGRSSTKLLWIVEGVNDIRFLRRIGRLLRHVDPQAIDLSALEQQGRLIFLPQGGGPVLANADRLALLGCPQFYLFDREGGSITEQRKRVAEAINNHPALTPSSLKSGPWRTICIRRPFLMPAGFRSNSQTMTT